MCNRRSRNLHDDDDDDDETQCKTALEHGTMHNAHSKFVQFARTKKLAKIDENAFATRR